MCFCWLLLAFLGFLSPAAIFVCVFAGFIWLFLGFWCPRRFLSVFLLALCGFSLVFCVRGGFCLCFCWLYVAFLGFFASAGFFVCVFAGRMWLFLGFLRRGLLTKMLNITGRQSNQPNSAPGGTTGLPESDSGGTKGGNQIQSHSLLTPVRSADLESNLSFPCSLSNSSLKGASTSVARGLHSARI